jgi:hypothetical protein
MLTRLTPTQIKIGLITLAIVAAIVVIILISSGDKEGKEVTLSDGTKFMAAPFTDIVKLEMDKPIYSGASPTPFIELNKLNGERLKAVAIDWKARYQKSAGKTLGNALRAYRQSLWGFSSGSQDTTEQLDILLTKLNALGIQ